MKEADHLQEEKVEEKVVQKDRGSAPKEMEVLEEKEAVRLQEEKADFTARLQDALKVLRFYKTKKTKKKLTIFVNFLIIYKKLQNIILDSYFESVKISMKYFVVFLFPLLFFF